MEAQAGNGRLEKNYRPCKAGGQGFEPPHVHQSFTDCKELTNFDLPQSLDIRAHCARTVRECGGCTRLCTMAPPTKLRCSRRNFVGPPVDLVQCFALHLQFTCDYFLKTCASPWRSIWVTHSSATPPALKRVA